MKLGGRSAALQPISHRLISVSSLKLGMFIDDSRPHATRTRRIESDIYMEKSCALSESRLTTIALLTMVLSVNRGTQGCG